jgi:hypothetical protein
MAEILASGRNRRNSKAKLEIHPRTPCLSQTHCEVGAESQASRNPHEKAGMRGKKGKSAILLGRRAQRKDA